jgi:inosine-uridine nucleoside N-ribohydrolase
MSENRKISRIVPELPAKDKKIRLIIDSDVANEIDDLYAISLALLSQERFTIEGFVATHYAASAGPDSTDISYSLLLKLLDAAGVGGRFVTKRGGHPMQYMGTYSASEGVDFIIERAFCAAPDDPLWVVGLGAATNLASAILKEPSIASRVRYVYHARSHMTWPERSIQYNIKGDILAARTLLSSEVPLVWFDTGTYLTRTMADTEKHVATTGQLGRFLHEYRYNRADFMREDKGFFDMGDIAWMIKPELCLTEIVKVPTMDQTMYFSREADHGEMLRIYDIDRSGTWALLDERLASRSASLRCY